jgi:hypothetical protein
MRINKYGFNITRYLTYFCTTSEWNKDQQMQNRLQSYLSQSVEGIMGLNRNISVQLLRPLQRQDRMLWPWPIYLIISPDINLHKMHSEIAEGRNKSSHGKPELDVVAKTSLPIFQTVCILTHVVTKYTEI